MGLFELRRRLAAESRHKDETAAAQTDALGEDRVAGLIAAAWQQVRDPVLVARLYTRVAKQEPAVALLLARLAGDGDGDRAAEAIRGLLEEQRALAIPYLSARLFGDERESAADLLVDLADARAAKIALELASASDDDGFRGLAAAVAAAGGDAAILEAAARMVPEEVSPAGMRLALELARRGHAAGHAALAAALEAWLAEWRSDPSSSSSDYEGPFALIASIAEVRSAAAVPALLACIETPCVAHALDALARIADPRALGPARAVLAELRATEPARAWAYVLAAENCLSALGEPQPLTTAREAFARVRPVRYGYPTAAEVLQIRELAGAALLQRGDAADLELVARLARDSSRVLRGLGLAALAKLGRPAPALRWLDPPAVAQRLKREGAAALIGLLDDPHAVFVHNAALALAHSEEPSAQQAALRWALGVLEGTENYPVDSHEEGELGEAAALALQVLERLDSVAACKPAIAATTSVWARGAILGEEPPPPPKPTRAGGPWRAEVRRLDRAPFGFGRKISGLALDADAERLAVVGDQLGQIVDAKTGATLVSLQLEYVWAHDCAFSPDGEALAVAYHGGHVVVFDARTGARLRELKGFGGVPDGVKRLAFAPGGELLAAGGSDGSARVFDWRTGAEVWNSAPGDGSFEAVAFSPNGDTCLFGHVKVRGGEENYLLALEVATMKARKVAVDASVWSLAFDPGKSRWLVGGEKKSIRPLGPALKPGKSGPGQKDVVRMAIAPDGSLLAASSGGELRRWDLAAGASKELGPIEGELWALCVAPDGTVYAGGSAGEVLRFSARGKALVAKDGETHSQQLTGIAALPDGGALTCSWDGRVLRWPAEFGAARRVVGHKERLSALVLTPDGGRACVATEGAVLVVDLADEKVVALKAGRDRVEDVTVRGDAIAAADSGGRVYRWQAGEKKAQWVARVEGEPSAIAFLDDGALLVGTDEGRLLEIDAAGEVVWSRAEHGVDLVDKFPLGNPHRSVAGVAAHGERFASVGTDDSLRVFERASHRRTLRILTPVGLFNDCAASPDGSVIASAHGYGLHVFSLESGETLLSLHAQEFPGADELTCVHFAGPRRVLVGAENGGLFEVEMKEPA